MNSIVREVFDSSGMSRDVIDFLEKQHGSGLA